MDFQTDCGLFEEQNNQEVSTPPVKDSCLFLINEDSGLGMDIVSSIFFLLFTHWSAPPLVGLSARLVSLLCL